MLSEVVYVLEKVYKINRKDIGTALTAFLKNADIDLPYRDVILNGLAYYTVRKLDFVDCILAGYAKVEEAEIHTFDSNLKKLIRNDKSNR